ncbi:MAG TPA: ATP-binding protein [Pyrinomonadaceae bacterium]|nr:ATP-binding protein [Pyrinomonadaceae bacterium]
MQKRRILIIDNCDGPRAMLSSALASLGHQVVTTSDRQEALRRKDLEDFDLIISDLAEEISANGDAASDLELNHSAAPANSKTAPTIVKSFKVGANTFRDRTYPAGDLREIVDQTLSCKLRHLDDNGLLSHTHEKIEFELPSDLGLMSGVLQYLIARVAKLGLIAAEGSNLYVALDEAFVNAVKHGNKNDPTKLVRVGADLSPGEACFTIEDEGEGFDVQTIPDPRDPANLFKSSGRGVLLIYNIMDEVEYNAQGNRVKMVKRPESSAKNQLVESDTNSDKHAPNV